MSDDLRTAESEPGLSNEEVSKFMNARPDKYACPICGNANWLGMADNTGATAGIPWIEGDSPCELEPVRVLTMFCGKCGFVRSHEWGIFTRYLRLDSEETE